MNKLYKIVFVTITLTMAGAWLCFNNAKANQANQTKQPIYVAMNHAKVVKLQADATSIVIGNPLFVDITIQDSKTLILTGKSFGTTNLIVLDEKGQEIINNDIIVEVYENNLLRIYRRAARQTLSCSPVCENTISLGDINENFQQVIEQVQSRNNISTPNNNP